MNRIVAIITARAGSKRIPGKNVKLFCGRPIIGYAIEAAKNSNMFDTVMVSTESDEIAEISKHLGAEVPFLRSRETSDDYATTADVLIEVLQEYERRGEHFDYGCCIYPTVPLLKGKTIEEAMRKLIETDADSLVPVVRFSYPPQRGFVIENDYLRYRFPENKYSRSQDLETLYHDAGQFYCFKVESFLRTKNLVSDTSIPLILSERLVQDIDNQEDWELAEMKYKIISEDSNGK